MCGSVDETKRYTCNMTNIHGTSRSFISPEILLVCTMGGIYIPVRIGDERHVLFGLYCARTSSKLCYMEHM